MPEVRTDQRSNMFKPRSHALALEQRILFDGAAAASVDHQQDAKDSTDSGSDTTHMPTTPVEASPATTPQAAARHLLVIDSRVENREQLIKQLPSDAKALVVDTNENGIDAIEKALETLGQVDSIQILSHGSPGQFTLGSTTISSDNITQLGQQLAQWKDNFSEGADIQLYGCKVGAGNAGQTLVAELARWTGADVAASSDDTGSLAAGGDWQLEVQVGDIDQAIALSDTALAGFNGLLADAVPTLSISAPGDDVQLGSDFTFNLSFTNNSTQTGYAPYIDLFMPVTGSDGAGAEIDDGVSFVSASYLGQNLTTHVLTFDANGQAVHPLAVGSDGQPLIINAADYGLIAGDQMVVIELPFASVNQGQPPITVQITAHLSDLADTDFSFSQASPDLVINARAGFQYGNDALNNPTTDPSLVEADGVSFIVHPTVITFDQTITAPEGETATGPNYGRQMDLTVSPATDQPITNLVITQPVPDNVIITAIDPGPGGTITTVTLYDGRTSSDPAVIQAALALNNDADLSNDLYIQSFTVTYANLNAPVTTTVDFFVPDADVDGNPVLDPVTGDPVTITFGAPSASGQWVPLDTRDVENVGDTIAFSGDGNTVSVVAKSITLLKQVSIQTDVGTTGLSPGDTLEYNLQMDLSDYFAFGENILGNGSFIIADSLGDGQTLVPGTLSLTVTFNGTTQIIPITVTSVVNADGSSSLAFDVGAAMKDFFTTRGWLNGDLAFDDTLDGATTAVLSYQATISQSYTPPAGDPHSEINEGDSIGNNATVTATILEDTLNLTGSDQADNSSTTSTIPTSNVDIELANLNGGGAPAPGTELRPGDEVTFSVGYDLVTGDYENFSLTVYLPLPLFDLGPLSQAEIDSLWSLGSGNTNPNSPVSVVVGPGNSLVFTFSDYVNTGVEGSRIEIDFTLTVSDQPFADNRSFNVLAESSQTTTLDKNVILSSDDVALIASVAEPSLSITHGVVSSSNGTVSGVTGGWNPPGSGGVPFTGGSLTEIGDIDGSVSDVDGGDLLRLATAIENSGGGGAYDVSTSITLPAGLSFVGGSLSTANLMIYRGDGTLMTLGTDYTVDNATNTITFIDLPGAGALLAGRPGTAADQSGENLVLITYDVVVASNIDASATLQSSGALLSYASVEGGANFLANGVDSDLADQQVAAPEISKNFAGGSLDNSDSSASHTTGADLVVGESMLYDIVVTLPEGTTQTLSIDDLIPPGMRLDTSFNGLGYEIITTAGGSLSANFAGTVTISGLNAPSGTLGDDGVDARFTFSAASASADNDTGNNSFVIRVRLVASDVISNQAGTVLQNNASLSYNDTDGDTPNGTAPTDSITRDVSLTGGQPAITVREPTLQISQQLQGDPGFGYDEGDAVNFTITVANGNAGTDFDAFDISFNSALPSQLDNLQLVSVIYTVGGQDFDLTSSFSLDPTGRTLVNTANIDIAKGGTLVISVSGVVNASGASVPEFNSQAEVRWSSLDGSNTDGSADPSGERTGADGLLNSGVVDDYRLDSTLVIPVAQGIRISRVGGLDDTSAPDPTNATDENVAIGELIRYRATALLPEGTNENYQMVITLPPGLTLADLSSMRIGFISNGVEMKSSLLDLILSGTLQIPGNEDSTQAGPITSDLSGAGPTGVLNPAVVAGFGTFDAQGNQVITLNLGTITNGDTDADLEGIVIEFSVRVMNVVSNQDGARIGVFVQDFVDGQQRATSDTLYENIVEPSFTLDKQVVDFDPNPGGTTGTATVSTTFTATGDVPAYNVVYTAGFQGATSITLVSVTINGVVYDQNNPTLPPGVTASGDSLLFDQIDPGTTVIAIYDVVVPNDVALQGSDDSLTWSSLPDDFTSWGESLVGNEGDADGERTGDDGAGPASTVLNNYQLLEGAGLGIITGTLWNDTETADTDTTPDGPGLANQQVDLIWAGLDGIFDTGDEKTFSTTTDLNGQFIFGVLPAGLYRIDSPEDINSPAAFGDLHIRIDTDGTDLGQINITLGEADSQQANSGYVELNDAPTIAAPDSQTVNEDQAALITGITVADVDAERDPDTDSRDIQVTLTVKHGTLFLSGTTTGVVVTGANSNTLVLQGRIDAINAALTSLNYLSDLNYNTADPALDGEFLTIDVNDLGNYGDFNDNGIPGETDDERTATDRIDIIVNAVNDAPTAVVDEAIAVEAGGTDNRLPGVNPTGNLTDNDLDPDLITNPNIEDLDLVSVAFDGVTTNVPANGNTVEIKGKYGSLFVDISGAYQYVVDNDNLEVQALRISGQTLTEVFDYTISDQGNPTATANSSSTLTVTIEGANDTPVGVDDTFEATEQGGVNNSDTGNPNDTITPAPGENATGNVLANDTDVDSVANDETKRVSGIRATPEASPDALTLVPDGGSVDIDGLYGTLTIFSDGSFTYVIDNSNPDVQRLDPSQTLTDVFSYQVTDAGGLNDLAQLNITVKGNYDNPVASDDLATAQAGESDDDGNESNPSGNVILNPSRPGDPTDNGIDQDVDGIDRPNTLLTVNGIRNGPEAAGGTFTAVTATTVLDTLYAEDINGVPLANSTGAAYGQLTINPDGTASFDVNSDHPDIVALPLGTTLNVIVTYQITDSEGLTDTAQIVITVRGANNVPIAQDEVAFATEAGGVLNATPGVNPTGTLDTADPDGDPITVTAVRTGPEGGAGTAGTIGTALRGTYGSLTLNADGTYSYVVDNDMAEVQALRLVSDILIERFTYTIEDLGGLSDSAEIVVVIRGQNDNPVATDDGNTATEAGGVNNGAGGVNPTGNVLSNDTDVDGGEIAADPIGYGESKAVNSVRTGATEGAGTTGTLGSELRGNYGWLTLGANGQYTYRLDNSMAEVQALRAGNQLTDSFNYSVIDASGATDIAVLNITIQGANDAPVASNDTAFAVEAGGLNNTTPGTNPSGNVLANDNDVDLNGEQLSVSGVRNAAGTGTVGSQLAGTYGSLLLNSDGSYTYTVDNNNALVQALRTSINTLSENFTYTIRDLAGATSTATLTVLIRGQNDNPVAVNDSATAVEAGGTNNGTPGINPSSPPLTNNLLTNDTDVDSGDSKTIDGIRTGTEAAGGAFTLVNGSQSIVGTYGILTVQPNGAYSYVVDNDKVESLKPGDSVQEVFTYSMHDTAGAQDTAQFVITIQGAWDAPVADNDSGIAVADNGDGRFIDPIGNVLDNDTDVDQGDSLTVTAIRTGEETASGTAGTVGTALVGQYGTLTINADGTYQYILDSSNPAVQALNLLERLNDYFTYTTTDQGGLNDQAQLTILIIGRNDPPVANDDAATAVEAGGLNNATPGVNPSGNVLGNDTDLESGTLTVTAVRTGSESGSGTSGAVGTSLRGQYGDLVLNADGSWNYVLDNSLAAVQALRTSGQTLTDTFTYTIQDPFLADDQAQLVITIEGRNDTPIAFDDNATAVEAGGIANGTAGVDPVGNVLDNDTDVDSVANGETKQVLSFTSELGQSAAAGQVLKGRYGSLTINANGSYQYVLDNDNPTVQAMRTAGETLREVFTYRMRDTAGAESTARLNLLIQGANDNPVAVNDSSVASDQFLAPQTSGNVLLNDSDVDGGDSLQVSAIRTGAETASGTSGSLGQPLNGRYGTLVINADGSYTYSIDLTNNEVLAAAGLGQVLQDVFTYTLVDLAGATDLAELVINLDISAPFIPAPQDGPFHYQRYPGDNDLNYTGLKDVEPAVFVTPVVNLNNRLNILSSRMTDGSQIRLESLPGVQNQIEQQRLEATGQRNDQQVHQAVLDSQFDSELDLAWILGRQGRVDLTADGLLSDPSVFASLAKDLTQHHQVSVDSVAQTAPGFRSQLQAAAKRHNLYMPPET